jgi:hypothetical protein
MVVGESRTSSLALGSSAKTRKIKVERLINSFQSLLVLLFISLSQAYAYSLEYLISNPPLDATVSGRTTVCTTGVNPLDIFDEKNGYFKRENGDGSCEVIVWRSKFIHGEIVVFSSTYGPFIDNLGEVQIYAAYLFDGKWHRRDSTFPYISDSQAMSLYSRFKEAKLPVADKKLVHVLFLKFPRYGKDVNVYFDVTRKAETLIGKYVFDKGKFAFVPRH